MCAAIASRVARRCTATGSTDWLSTPSLNYRIRYEACVRPIVDIFVGSSAEILIEGTLRLQPHHQRHSISYERASRTSFSLLVAFLSPPPWKSLGLSSALHRSSLSGRRVCKVIAAKFSGDLDADQPHQSSTSSCRGRTTAWTARSRASSSRSSASASLCGVRLSACPVCGCRRKASLLQVHVTHDWAGRK